MPVQCEARCGDCKFWGETEDMVSAYDDDDNEIECDLRRCSVILSKPSRGEYLVHMMVIAVGGSGYFAAVRSRADFGCVLFEPKA